MPHLAAVPPPVENSYSELSESEQAGILRNSIKELEQKLFVARANAKMQARLIGAPIAESRKNTARRALREFQEAIPDLQISIECLQEELAAIDVPKEDDGDRSDNHEGADEGHHEEAAAEAVPG